MIGVDTNVLIRLLIGDDERQQRQAHTYLLRHSSADDPAWVNRIVAVETVWVLERRYGYARKQIADVLERLLNTAELSFENHDLVRDAIGAYREGAGFSDALIAAGNAAADCSTTVTFDARAAKQVRRFTLLK
ncbi:MAG: type II toxin-antitoxin system VapC family toxin [Candidatus Tumulicola sp.]